MTAYITSHAVQQSDQALETAIAFIQARQASEVSYGRSGRSAGCIVTHPKFRERWLKVMWAPAGAMSRLMWDGEVLAIDLQGVSKPRIFGYFDWEAIGICYRAIMMSVARGVISDGPWLRSSPILESDWWDRLADAIAKIQAKRTDRIYVADDEIVLRLKERF